MEKRPTIGGHPGQSGCVVARLGPRAGLKSARQIHRNRSTPKRSGRRHWSPQNPVQSPRIVPLSHKSVTLLETNRRQSEAGALELRKHFGGRERETERRWPTAAFRSAVVSTDTGSEWPPRMRSVAISRPSQRPAFVTHDGYSLVTNAIHCTQPTACPGAINRTTQLIGCRVTETAVGGFDRCA